ncbi:hypothetical protein BAE44_0009430 [Dichanthelium oligosanthes]|uniref:ZC3H15/TMA46 family C-terminal domain-containing protein n=1 Tax=Dichanthelium oligosanthes TaxID=888268 RepID=A0A1E5VWQ3_9POAL|nr:hypothetical protein BAE44_0009430 [Dichanthelium oligosanthes]
MGAEAEGTPPPQPHAGEPATAARAQPISAAQFLSWKQRKRGDFSDALFVFLTCRRQRKPQGKLKQLRSEPLISLQERFR